MCTLAMKQIWSKCLRPGAIFVNFAPASLVGRQRRETLGTGLYLSFSRRKRFSQYFRLYKEALAMKTATPRTTLWIKVFIFYPRMSQMCRSVQYTYRFKTCSGEMCNASILFSRKKRKISHCTHSLKLLSFLIRVVLQRTTKKCLKYKSIVCLVVSGNVLCLL